MPTLTELSILDSERAQQIMRGMLRWSPLLRFLEERSAFVLDATKFESYPDAGNRGLQTRPIGGSYTKSAELPPARREGDMGFQGDALTIDRAHVRDHIEGVQPLGPWIDSRMINLVKLWARALEKAIIQGDGEKSGENRNYIGWQTMLNGQTNVAPWGTTMVIDAVEFLSTNPDSLDLSDPAHQKAFMEGMEQVLPNFDDPGVVANNQVGAKLSSMAREYKRFGDDYDSFGNKVLQIDGQQIVRTADGSISNTEPDNASTPNENTTSTYICSPGPGLYNFKTHGLEVEDETEEVIEEVRSGKLEWEVRGDNDIEDRYALWRIRNIHVPGGSSDYLDQA